MVSILVARIGLLYARWLGYLIGTQVVVTLTDPIAELSM
jgi:hypothetical protein